MTIRVGHLVNPFLPVTQNWMYNQIVQNSGCDSFVLCRTTCNLDQFPLKNVFPVFKHRSVSSVISEFKARVCATYPLRPYLDTITRIKPDILHGHFAWESWRNRRLAKKTALPLVTTFYGLDVCKLPRRPIWHARYRKLFAFGALFVVEGPFMGASLEKLGCPPEKIRVVRLGVDIDSLAAKSVWCNDSGTIDIMFVGLNREKKGAIYAASAFARAAQQLPQLRLHIVGDGRYRAEVQKIFDRYSVSDPIIFHGFLSVDRYKTLLDKMDLVLAPSITAADGDTEGGAPVTVIEAQVRGIPVIGSDHCDIPDIVVDGETGLIVPERDIEGLTNAIVSLARDRSARKALGEAAIRRSHKRHNLKQQVVALTELYQSLL